MVVMQGKCMERAVPSALLPNILAKGDGVCFQHALHDIKQTLFYLSHIIECVRCTYELCVCVCMIVCVWNVRVGVPRKDRCFSALNTWKRLMLGKKGVDNTTKSHIEYKWSVCVCKCVHSTRAMII